MWSPGVEGRGWWKEAEAGVGASSWLLLASAVPGITPATPALMPELPGCLWSS